MRVEIKSERVKVKAFTPEQVIELIDKAFHEADVEALVDLYDDAAVQVDYIGVNQGKEARGKQELRDLYSRLLVKPGHLTVKQIKTQVVEADGIALFTSRWSVSSDQEEPKTYIATVVLRQQPDGSWKDLIDSSPAVLDR